MSDRTSFGASPRGCSISARRAFLAAIAVTVCLLSTGTSAAPNDLIRASEIGNLPRVKELIAAKADVNARTGDGTTALLLASQNGHLEIVRTLLTTNPQCERKRRMMA